MKLLLDANLSWRLIEVLKENFSECLHVDKIGYSIPVTDFQIWNYAKDNNLIIVTNDEDFLNFMNTKGFPPKVVLLRTGNQANAFIASILIKHKREIESLSGSSDYGLLEIY